MKTKLITTISLTLFVAATMFICGDNQKPDNKNPHQMHHKKSAAQSKVVVVDGVQFAFDLMPMKMHKAMMKDMKTKMSGPADANYAVMVTLMKKPANQLIKNAKVNLGITMDGKVKKIPAEVMQGAGMYHYGTHLKLGKGEIKIKATAKIGSKQNEAQAKFSLK